MSDAVCGEAIARGSPPLDVQTRRIESPRHPDRHALLVTAAAAPVRALAVELHGSGLDADRQQSISRLVDQLLPRGFAVLFPEAAIPFELWPGTAGFAWNVPGSPLPGEVEPLITAVDDLRWVVDITKVAQCDLDLARAPLVLVGYSGGARLASHLLVAGSLPWTAAALVSGLRAVEGADHPPPPTIAFHGLEDQVNPYRGSSDRRWSMSVVDAADRYAAAQGCLPGFAESRSPSGKLRVYSTGDGRLGLTLCSVLRAGHAWPGSTDAAHLAAFGPAGAGLDASSLIAIFFERRAFMREPSPSERDTMLAATASGTNRATQICLLGKDG